MFRALRPSPFTFFASFDRSLTISVVDEDDGGDCLAVTLWKKKWKQEKLVSKIGPHQVS